MLTDVLQQTPLPASWRGVKVSSPVVPVGLVTDQLGDSQGEPVGQL